MPKTHIYKEKGEYQIKVHHKDIPLGINYLTDANYENRIDIANSIISVEQWGLCSYAIPCFNVIERTDSLAEFSHGMENLQSIPPLPNPYLLGDNSSFGNLQLYAFANSRIKTLPNGFFENMALSAKEHPDIVYDLSYLFVESKIETLPEDLFKPFVDFSFGSQIQFYHMFDSCPIKDRFPPKYQPLDWNTEEGQGAYKGIFVGCKKIPNYDEIPHILRSPD